MNQSNPRHCIDCDLPLPDGSRSDRKYCDNRCRTRATRKRRRATDQRPPTVNLRWRYDVLKKDQAKTERKLDRARQDRVDAQRELAKVQRRLVNREAYISSQAERVAEARQRATQLLIERDEAQRKANESAIDPDEFARTQQFLDDGRAAYKELRQRYESLAATLESAANERKSLKEVVRSWDGLCQRIYQETKGRPRNAKDRETLTLWQEFRRQMKQGSSADGSGEQ